MKATSACSLLPALHGNDCEKTRQVLARVGEKWSVLIVISIAEGPRRFTDIKRSIEGISQRMLTVYLRALERDGIIRRTVRAFMPPHVEYELTALGRSLIDPVLALGTWARDHLADIDLARASFDQRVADKLGAEDISGNNLTG